MSAVLTDLILIEPMDNTKASLWVLPIISLCTKGVDLNYSWAIVTSNWGISISTCPLINGVCLGVSRIITLHLKWRSRTDRYLGPCFITGCHQCFTCQEKGQNVYVVGEDELYKCPHYLRSPDLKIYYKWGLCLMTSRGQCDGKNSIIGSEGSASQPEKELSRSPQVLL